MPYSVQLNSTGKSYVIPASGETAWVAGLVNGQNGLSLYLKDLAAAVNSATGGAVVTPLFNVKTYGAVGNGVTDDTTAVNLAIAAATTAGGGQVYFPSGTYVISSTLTATVANTRFTGDGTTSILKQTGAFSTTPLLKFLNAPNGGIQALKLDGSANTGTGSLVLLDGSNTTFVTQTSFANSKAYAIDTIGGATPSTGLTVLAPSYTTNALGDINGTHNGPGVRDNGAVYAYTYGAIGNGINDDTAALNLAIAAVNARPQGGTVFLPMGIYRITSQLLLSGTRWIGTESDITSATNDPTAVPSYNAAAKTTATAAPVVNLIGEPGTIIWADFAPSIDTAAIYVGMVGSYARQPTVIENISIFTRAGMSSGGTVLATQAGAPSTNVSGIFCAGNTRLDIRNCQGYGVSRFIVAAACYWSRIDNCEVCWANKGLVIPGFNAAEVQRYLASSVATNAIEVAGQAFALRSIWTEQCTTSLYVANADSFQLDNFYFEATTPTYTDYQIRFGDGTHPVLWGSVRNGTLSSVYGKTMQLNGAQVDFYSTRFYDQGVDAQRAGILGTNVCNFFHCDIRFQAAVGYQGGWAVYPAKSAGNAAVSSTNTTANSSFTATVTCPGLPAGYPVQVGVFADPGGWSYNAYASANGTATLVITNISGSTASFPTRTLNAYWNAGTP